MTHSAWKTPKMFGYFSYQLLSTRKSTSTSKLLKKPLSRRSHFSILWTSNKSVVIWGWKRNIKYVHILWQRLASGSKSVIEDPQSFDKIFIIGQWNANLTEKKKINSGCLIIQLGFCYRSRSIKFQIDYILHASSPFAFNTKLFFLFFWLRTTLFDHRCHLAM